jgi:cell wall-associated NlpC family hydrolase
MNIFRKTLIIAGISSIMLCTTAFATEVTVSDDLNTQENSQTESINVDNIQSQEIQVTETKEAVVQAEVQLQQGTVSVDILNIRSGPSTDTEILGKLSLGSTINIKTTSNGWHEIEFNGSSAYVYAEYVKIIDLSAAALSPSGNSVVDYAKLFIGTPYVAGGSSPSGFDCSGFVKYVMANFGVDMPRTSTDQYSIGVRVEKSELMPGDLVFFKYSSTSYRLNHVGIYVGDGNFIHSPIPGQTVKIDTLSSGYFSTYYYGATRVVK